METNGEVCANLKRGILTESSRKSRVVRCMVMTGFSIRGEETLRFN